MAAKLETLSKDELTLSEKIGEFIQRNRTRLLAGLCAIVLVIAGFIIVSVVREKNLSNALSKLDALSRRYNDLSASISTEEEMSASQLSELAVLIADIAEFENKNSGFPAARAYSISASIYMDQKKWEQAEEKWLKAAEAAPKTYLAPIAIYNAAVAAEGRNNIETAIAYYTRAAGFRESFPSAVRAQFSIGRLEESRNNKDSAIAAYRSLLSNWPNDPVWPNLAQNRLLILTD
jgi:tetratricopeptide (TPR) repeat protein